MDDYSIRNCVTDYWEKNKSPSTDLSYITDWDSYETNKLVVALYRKDAGKIYDICKIIAENIDIEKITENTLYAFIPEFLISRMIYREYDYHYSISAAYVLVKEKLSPKFIQIAKKILIGRILGDSDYHNHSIKSECLYPNGGEQYDPTAAIKFKFSKESLNQSTLDHLIIVYCEVLTRKERHEETLIPKAKHRY